MQELPSRHKRTVLGTALYSCYIYIANHLLYVCLGPNALRFLLHVDIFSCLRRVNELDLKANAQQARKEKAAEIDSLQRGCVMKYETVRTIRTVER